MSSPTGLARVRASLERRLQRLWFGPHGPIDRLWAGLLWPLHAAVAARARARRDDIAQRKAHGRGSDRPPVVVIGNLVVGGTGKTPVIIALTQALQARGWRPGILASGYGSTAYSATPRTVTLDADATQVGDEPLLLARRTGLPVVVGRDRLAGLRWLSRHHDCNLILSDDGLQHAALPRDLELAVFDGRGAGNQRCLPAGPLREPLSSALLVDALLLNGRDTPAPLVHSRVFRFEMVPTDLIRLDGQQQWSPADWSAIVAGQRLHAVAALGAPQRFFAMLGTLGLAVQCHALADHARIDPAWLGTLAADWFIITEKDAVKCAAWPPALQARCVVLRVRAELDPRLTDWLEDRLHG